MAQSICPSLLMAPGVLERGVHGSSLVPTLHRGVTAKDEALQRTRHSNWTLTDKTAQLRITDFACNALRTTEKGRTALRTLQTMAAQQEALLSKNLPTEQVSQLHALPSGKRLEVIKQPARQDGEAGRTQPLEPLVFIHGSYHAAWCWAEFWMPYFATLGHDCYAISLLGQGGSDLPDGPVAGTIQSHAADIAHFIRETLEAPPVLVGHSFGGLIIQAYLADVGAAWKETASGSVAPYPSLAGAILACSVPPTGNMGLVMRYIQTKPIASVKVTLSLAAKLFEKWTWLCRESFFSPAMPDAEVQRFQELLRGSSKVPLFDLRKLNAALPVAQPPQHAPPILILGAENDFVVDEEGLNETATFFGVEPVVVPNIAHDVMLDLEWRSAADVVENWLQTIRQQRQ